MQMIQAQMTNDQRSLEQAQQLFNFRRLGSILTNPQTSKMAIITTSYLL